MTCCRFGKEIVHEDLPTARTTLPQGEEAVMVPSFVARRVRWAWLAAVSTALWVNRRDVLRWIVFLRRSLAQRGEITMSSWMTEARVRAAISRDPVLRADPALDDVEVDDGRVVLRSRLAAWPGSADHVARLGRVKGVAEVSCRPSGAARPLAR